MQGLKVAPKHPPPATRLPPNLGSWQLLVVGSGGYHDVFKGYLVKSNFWQQT